MSYGVLRLKPRQVDDLSLGEWLDLLGSQAWVKRERERRTRDPNAEVTEDTRSDLLNRIGRVYGG